MDSKAINKLIRSEIWPRLRLQGFSYFDTRNAWRDRGHYVDVVNFQSFSSHLADGLGCTTYSFCLNLGILVKGSVNDSWIKKDPKGRLKPQEAMCNFRSHLQKRNSFDGLKRLDIFYVDFDGNSIVPVFDEVKYLLSTTAPDWFRALADTDVLLEWTSGGKPPTDVSEYLPFGLFSRAQTSLTAALLLLKHEECPAKESSQKALAGIDQFIGAIQSNAFTPDYLEDMAILPKSFLLRLGRWMPSFNLESAGINGKAQLLPASFTKARDAIAFDAGVPFSVREMVWPHLKETGFSEFTDTLAHRTNPGSVAIVEISPVGKRERKKRGLPDGLFRVGVGLYWPNLRLHDYVRKNRNREYRPNVESCHLQMWLLNENAAKGAGPTLFRTIEEAMKTLQEDGLTWLSLVQDFSKLIQLLENPNWKIFVNYPMMSGQGCSAGSIPRCLLLAVMAHHWGNKCARDNYLTLAENGLMDAHNERFVENYQTWITRVKTQLLASEHEAKIH